MMGKWSKFKDSFQKFIPENDYQEKVNELKEELKQRQDKSISVVAEELKKLKAEQKEIKQKQTQINLEAEARQQLLIEWLDSNNMDSIRLSSGGVFTQRVEPYSYVTDREALLVWAKKNKLDKVLQFPWATLNSMVKEDLQNGNSLPPGVEVFIKTTLSLYGGKKEEDGQET